VLGTNVGNLIEASESRVAGSRPQRPRVPRLIPETRPASAKRPE